MKKLDNRTEKIYFKDAEILEDQWNFLTVEIAKYIEGGDAVVAEQFRYPPFPPVLIISSLTHKLVYRLLNYLETQLKGPGVKTASEMTKWYTKLLENVRLRHRKLLRFSRYAGPLGQS